MTDMDIRSNSLLWSTANRAKSTEAKPATDEKKQFQCIFIACFVLFLVVVTVARLLGGRWRPWPPGGPEGYQSIIHEAKAAANTFIPFAFMG